MVVIHSQSIYQPVAGFSGHSISRSDPMEFKLLLNYTRVCRFSPHSCCSVISIFCHQSQSPQMSLLEPGAGPRPRARSPFLKLRLVETAAGVVPKGDGTLTAIPIPASYQVSPICDIPHPPLEGEIYISSDCYTDN